MKFDSNLVLALAAILPMAACSGASNFGRSDDLPSLPPAGGSLQSATSSAQGLVSDTPVKIGEPYKIGNKTYTPAEVASYDKVGYASWYGSELAGRPTANGEPFNPNGFTAAHKTLPLPTYVEVTALDTGKTILVRINDRGPFANDRLIDLSQAAARQLGIENQGVAGVRVRKVNPNPQERALVRSGQPATERIPTPDSLLTILRSNLQKLPTPAAPVRRAAAAPPIGRPTTAPLAGTRDGRFVIENSGVAAAPIAQTPSRPGASFTQPSTAPAARSSASGFVVQVGAFSDRARAVKLAQQIGAKVTSDANRTVWRVRYGPYASENAAQSGLDQARQRGYNNARVLRADK